MSKTKNQRQDRDDDDDDHDDDNDLEWHPAQKQKPRKSRKTSSAGPVFNTGLDSDDDVPPLVSPRNEVVQDVNGSCVSYFRVRDFFFVILQLGDMQANANVPSSSVSRFR